MQTDKKAVAQERKSEMASSKSQAGGGKKFFSQLAALGVCWGTFLFGDSMFFSEWTRMVSCQMGEGISVRVDG